MKKIIFAVTCVLGFSIVSIAQKKEEKIAEVKNAKMEKGSMDERAIKLQSDKAEMPVAANAVENEDVILSTKPAPNTTAISEVKTTGTKTAIKKSTPDQQKKVEKKSKN